MNALLKKFTGIFVVLAMLTSFIPQGLMSMVTIFAEGGNELSCSPTRHFTQGTRIYHAVYNGLYNFQIAYSVDAINTDASEYRIDIHLPGGNKDFWIIVPDSTNVHIDTTKTTISNDGILSYYFKPAIGQTLTGTIRTTHTKNKKYHIPTDDNFSFDCHLMREGNPTPIVSAQHKWTFYNTDCSDPAMYVNQFKPVNEGASLDSDVIYNVWIGNNDTMRVYPDNDYAYKQAYYPSETLYTAVSRAVITMSLDKDIDVKEVFSNGTSVTYEDKGVVGSSRIIEWTLPNGDNGTGSPIETYIRAQYPSGIFNVGDEPAINVSANVERLNDIPRTLNYTYTQQITEPTSNFHMPNLPSHNHGQSDANALGATVTTPDGSRPLTLSRFFPQEGSFYQQRISPSRRVEQHGNDSLKYASFVMENLGTSDGKMLDISKVTVRYARPLDQFNSTQKPTITVRAITNNDDEIILRDPFVIPTSNASYNLDISVPSQYRAQYNESTQTYDFYLKKVFIDYTNALPVGGCFGTYAEYGACADATSGDKYDVKYGYDYETESQPGNIQSPRYSYQVEVKNLPRQVMFYGLGINLDQDANGGTKELEIGQEVDFYTPLSIYDFGSNTNYPFWGNFYDYKGLTYIVEAPKGMNLLRWNVIDQDGAITKDDIQMTELPIASNGYKYYQFVFPDDYQIKEARGAENYQDFNIDKYGLRYTFEVTNACLGGSYTVFGYHFPKDFVQQDNFYENDSGSGNNKKTNLETRLNFDFNNNGIIGDLFITGNRSHVPDGTYSNSAYFNINQVAALTASAYVKGNLNPDWLPSTETAEMTSGAKGQFKIVIENQGSVTAQNIKLIDIVPFIGDTFVMNNNPRNSQWNPIFNNLMIRTYDMYGNIKVEDVEPKTYFSTVGNPEITLLKNATKGLPAVNPAWTQVRPSNAEMYKVKSIGYDYGTNTLYPKEKIEIIGTLVAPIDQPFDMVAINTFAISADFQTGTGTFPTQESAQLKFKLTDPDKGEIKGRVFNDANYNGINDDEGIGVDGIEIELYDAGLDNQKGGGDDALITSTATTPINLGTPQEEHGRYLFANLENGSYYLKFKPSDDYRITDKKIGNDDSNDSDAINVLGSSYGETDIIRIVNKAKINNIDCGLTDIKGAIIVKHFNKNTNAPIKEDMVHYVTTGEIFIADIIEIPGYQYSHALPALRGIVVQAGSANNVIELYYEPIDKIAISMLEDIDSSYDKTSVLNQLATNTFDLNGQLIGFKNFDVNLEDRNDPNFLDNYNIIEEFNNLPIETTKGLKVIHENMRYPAVVGQEHKQQIMGFPGWSVENTYSVVRAVDSSISVEARSVPGYTSAIIANVATDLGLPLHEIPDENRAVVIYKSKLKSVTLEYMEEYESTPGTKTLRSLIPQISDSAEKLKLLIGGAGYGEKPIGQLTKSFTPPIADLSGFVFVRSEPAFLMLKDDMSDETIRLVYRRLHSNVVIKHVDSNNPSSVIETNVISPVDVNQPYSAYAKDFGEGWTLDIEKTNDQNGLSGAEQITTASDPVIKVTKEEGIVITFFYKKVMVRMDVEAFDSSTNEEVTASYSPDHIMVQKGVSATVSAPHVEGYFVTTGTDSEITLTGDDTKTFKFWYTKYDSLFRQVTVLAYDNATDTVITGYVPKSNLFKIGASVLVYAPAVQGYKLVTPSDNQRTHIVNEDITENNMIFYYRKIQENVVFQLVDDQDKVIYQTSANVPIGTLTTDAEIPAPTFPSFTGYTLDADSRSASHTKVEEEQQVIIKYTLNKVMRDVTVNYYKFGSSEEIATATTVNAQVGQTLTIAPNPSDLPPGWVLSGDTYQIYTVEEDANSVNFYYTDNTGTGAGAITIMAVDKNDHSRILFMETKPPVKADTTYDASALAPSITGWKNPSFVADMSDTITGSMPESGVRIVFEYAPDEVTVSVGFEPNTLTAPAGYQTLRTVQVGDNVTVSAPYILDHIVRGYKLDNGNLIQSSIVTIPTISANANIVFVYEHADDVVDKYTTTVKVTGKIQGGSELYSYDKTFKNSELPQNITATTLYGYKLVSTATVEIPADGSVKQVFFEYTSEKRDVTVDAIDQATGVRIVGFTPVVSGGIVGEEVKVSAPAITDYKLISAEPATKNHTVDDAANTVSFTYEKIKENVVYRFKDSDGVIRYQTSADVTVGTVTATITDTSLPAIVGWKLVADSRTESNFIVTNGIQTVISYTLEKDIQDITVNYYQDGSTTPVATATSQSGQVGQTVTVLANPATVTPGWVLKGAPYQTCAVSENGNVVNFYYENHTGSGAGAITVIAVSASDRAKVLSYTLSDPISAGTAYDASALAPSITGWKNPSFVADMSDTITGTMPESGVRIVFEYAPDEVTVSVGFEPSPLTAPAGYQALRTVQVGDNVTVSAPYIPDYIVSGYKLDGNTLVQSSIVTIPTISANASIVFVYEKYLSAVTVAHMYMDGDSKVVFQMSSSDIQTGQSFSGSAVSDSKWTLVKSTIDGEDEQDSSVTTRSGTVSSSHLIEFYYTKTIADIAIKGELEDGTPLTVTPDKSSGQLTESGVIHAPYLAGYEVVGDTIKNVVYGTDTEVLFVYKEVSDQSIVYVTCIDTTKVAPHNIISSFTRNGQIGKGFSINAPSIPNYQLVSGEPTMATGKYGTDSSIQFIYEPTVVSVTIFAKDELNVAIPGFVPLTIENVKTGMEFKTMAPVIANYEIADGQFEKSIENVSVTDNQITFIYKVSAGNIKIRAVESGNSSNIIGSWSDTGDVGSSYNAVANSFVGWIPGEVPTITIDANSSLNVVEIPYTKQLTTITVKAIDDDGGEVLATNEISNVQVGTQYIAVMPIIESYVLKAGESPSKGHYVIDGTNEIVFIYVKTQSNVLTVHRDIETGMILSLENEAALALYDYTAHAFDITGYLLVGSETTKTDKVPVIGSLNFEFLYVKNFEVVTVNLISTANNSVINSYTISVPLGLEYTVYAPHLTGYTLNGVNSHTVNVKSGEQKTIDFYYDITEISKVQVIVQVIDVAHDPIADAEVSLNGIMITTDENGEAVYDNFDPGDYKAIASKPGYNTTMVSGKTMASGSTKIIITMLEPEETILGAVYGYVTDKKSGMPIVGATIKIAGQNVMTNNKGYYVVANIALGSHTIGASYSGYNTSNKTLKLIDAASVQQDFALAVKIGGANITGGGGGVSNYTSAKLVVDAVDKANGDILYTQETSVIVGKKETVNAPYIEGYELDSDSEPVQELVVLTGENKVTFYYNSAEPKLEKDIHIKYISGYDDGTVHPDSPITRAEVAMIFFRLIKDNDKNTETSNIFSDVKSGTWYYQAINYLANKGILKGYDDGMFKPSQNISRAEFAAIASRFDNLDASKANIFVDVPNDHWAVSYINSAYNKGWISGYPNGEFMASNNITRAEVIKIINAMLDRKVDIANTYSDILEFSDLSSDHWAYADIVEATNEHKYVKDQNEEIWQR